MNGDDGNNNAHPEPQWCAEQIAIPPHFPDVLKQFTKAAIKSQPEDIYKWAYAYFAALTEGRNPPVSSRVVFDESEEDVGKSIESTPLVRLVSRLSYASTVDREALKGVWAEVGFTENALSGLLVVGDFEGNEIDTQHVLILAAASTVQDADGVLAFCSTLRIFVDALEHAGSVPSLGSIKAGYDFLAARDPDLADAAGNVWGQLLELLGGDLTVPVTSSHIDAVQSTISAASATEEEMDQAARTVQRHVRGYLARQQVEELKRASPAESDDLDDPALQDAAITIQSSYRGFVERKKMAKKAMEAEFDPEDEELQAAATEIQTAFRSHLARKAPATTQAEPAPASDSLPNDGETAGESTPATEGATESASTTEAAAIDIDLSDPEVAAAAGTIQAGFRGHQARKQVRQMRESQSEAVPADTAPAEESQPTTEVKDNESATETKDESAAAEEADTTKPDDASTTEAAPSSTDTDPKPTDDNVATGASEDTSQGEEKEADGSEDKNTTTEAEGTVATTPGGDTSTEDKAAEEPRTEDQTEAEVAPTAEEKPEADGEEQ